MRESEQDELLEDVLSNIRLCVLILEAVSGDVTRNTDPDHIRENLAGVICKLNDVAGMVERLL